MKYLPPHDPPHQVVDPGKGDAGWSPSWLDGYPFTSHKDQEVGREGHLKAEAHRI